ncbi:MAG: hypothetical protein WBA51_04915 [Erythrobacter sp.]
MSEYIWLSKSLGHAANFRDLTSDQLERDRDEAIECGRRSLAGESMGPECFPKEIWPVAGAGKSAASASADFFAGAAHWIVSGRFAELLRQFEMGGANLYPVKFLQADRETPAKGEWFCLNFGNVRRGLAPDESTSLRPTFKPNEWTVKAVLADFDVSFRMKDIGVEAAIWIDPSLINVLCLSAPLGDAMRDRGITKGFKGLGDMIRGRVI